MKRYISIFVMVIIAGLSASTYFVVRRVLIGKQVDGTYLVSSGQILSPVGRIETTQYARPKDLALSPDGQKVAVYTTGNVQIYSRAGDKLGEVKTKSAALGVCWSPDSRVIFASDGDAQIAVIGEKQGKWARTRTIDIKSTDSITIATSPQVVGLACDPSQQNLYAALGKMNAVARIKIETGLVETLLPVQVAPYRILLSHDGRTLFCANRAGEAPRKKEAAADSGGTMVAVDPHTDAALRGSISIIDLESSKTTSVAVGKQPSGMCLSLDQKRLYVADSDSDTVSIVDVPSKRKVGSITIKTSDDPELGRIPTDVRLSPDEKRLYVACGGINAVAVIGLETKPEVIGFIPSGWFPISLLADNKGLVVACSKGIGSRPSDKTTKYRVHDNVGLIQFVGYGEIKNLNNLSAQVAENNHWMKPLKARRDAQPLPVPWRVGEPSVFKHVIYIIKENLTYDIAMGDMKEGNGDPSLCTFGEEVTPNHHKLAREFVLLDNFYTSGTNSADGHQWTSASICNGYQEQNYGANQRSYPYDGGDPLAYSPKGYLWTATAKAGLGVRVYGEFVNKPKIAHKQTGKAGGFFDIWKDYQNKEGQYQISAQTDNASLRKYLHPNYIGFPMSVSDQWRADTFLAEFKKFEDNGNLPELCMLLLPNDHTAGTSTFFPTPRAMVADNDLALGRIVEAISKSKYWKDTLILVVEDDSQTGLDHVDGHRTVAFCISAYTRRGEVISEFYNHSSLIKTIELVLGIAPMNRFDYSANSMRECFAMSPNLAPYQRVANRVPLDERNPEKSALNALGAKLARLSNQQDWTQYDVADPRIVTQAIWFSTKPGVPFPWKQFNPPSESEDDD